MPSLLLPAAGAIACCAALVLLLLVVLRPAQGAVALARRRPFGSPQRTSALTRLAGAAVGLVEKRSGGSGPFGKTALELAGIRRPQAEFIILVAAATAVSALLGLLVSNAAGAIVLALLAPAGAALYVSVRAGRRRAKFGEQLGDNLMLLCGGLRAGHSILRAIDAASQEAPAPSAEEFARIVNESRIGRDLHESLLDTAVRMRSEDFGWIAQAIEINRATGGDLAQVLDQVGETIRERSQIKAQISTLSAEGRLSAYILLALPVGLFLLLNVLNPGYIAVLTGSVLGWILIGLALVLMTVGSLWMRKIIKLKF